MPPETPVTTPPEVVLAMAVLLLPHVPPPMSLSVVVDAWHTLNDVVEVMGLGSGFTVKTAVM